MARHNTWLAAANRLIERMLLMSRLVLQLQLALVRLNVLQNVVARYDMHLVSFGQLDFVRLQRHRTHYRLTRATLQIVHQQSELLDAFRVLLALALLLRGGLPFGAALGGLHGGVQMLAVALVVVLLDTRH